jgi:hypothetical protein
MRRRFARLPPPAWLWCGAAATIAGLLMPAQRPPPPQALPPTTVRPLVLQTPGGSLDVPRHRFLYLTG